jgi:hypothetical protein
MKQFILVIGILSVLLFGCDEVPPFVDFTDPPHSKDSTYIVSPVPAAQHKAVLIEDITGVRCNNCPFAAKKAQDIVQRKTEDSVVVMALYTESLATLTIPWPGFPSLTSPSATQLTSSLGLDGSLPNGYVDRTIFPPQQNRLTSYTVWETKVNQRLKEKTPVNIRIEDSVSGRKLKVKVRLQYTEAVSSTHKLSLFLVENGIVSKQTTTSGLDENYIHNHVLRYTFGSDLGKVLTASLMPGRTFVKELEYEIPLGIQISNCHIICVVSDNVTEEVVNVRNVEVH